MKQIVRYSYFFIILFFVAGFTSCVKDRNPGATDFSNLQPLLEIRDNISGVGNDAGLSNFSRATLHLLPADSTDTLNFYVNLASVNTLDKDLAVTVDINPAALTAYNGDPSHTVQFEMMPDSVYSLGTKTFTIPAGQRVAMVPVILYPNKIDPTKSYMLPLGIMQGQGVNISANYGTIYYHTIGNPYAGNYTVVGTRTNYTGAASGGVIAGVVDLASTGPKSASPESPTVVDITYANFDPSSFYIITFDPVTQTITDATVNADFTSTVSNFGVDFATYDAATKTIHIKSHYTNGAGNDRVIEETLTHQ